MSVYILSGRDQRIKIFPNLLSGEVIKTITDYSDHVKIIKTCAKS